MKSKGFIVILKTHNRERERERGGRKGKFGKVC